MKRTKLYMTALALGLTALIGAAVVAEARPYGSGGGYYGNGYPSNLTQEQQAQAQKAFADHTQKVAPLQQQLRAKQAELNALSYSDKPDNAKTQSLFKDIADIQAKLYSARIEFRKDLEGKGLSTVGMGPGYGRGQAMGPGHGGHRGGHARGGFGGGRW